MTVPPWPLLRGVQAGVLALCTVVGSAAEVPEIGGERAAQAARFEREQAECRLRFAANACLEEARDRHRRALTVLQERQRSADEARRRDRSEARHMAVERKRAAAVAREATPPAAKPPPPTAAADPASAPAARRPSAASERRRAVAAAQAAERASAAQRLQKDIQADQARIRQRLERRAAEGKVPQPLPLPAASAPR